MGEGFKSGAGGLMLNFKVVVSATEPTNPKENMVWINSDQKMTGWVFSHVQPTEAETGTVWIQTTTSLLSSVTINALKNKNKGINLYPLAAFQSDGSQWLEKPMKVCKNGSWGDMWTGLIYSSGTYYKDIPYVDIKSGADIGDTSNAIVFQWGLQEGVWRSGERVFGPIDITGFKTLTVSGSSGVYNGRSTTMTVRVRNSQGAGTALAYIDQTISGNSSATVNLDLSELTIEGEVYIAVGHGGGATLESGGYINHIKLNR